MILKITGIILLSAAVVLILLSFMVLFVPVNYRFDAAFPENNDSEIRYNVTAHMKWLAGIISFKAAYPDDSPPCLRIFGIRFRRKVKNNKKRKRKKRESNKNHTEQKQNSDAIVQKETCNEQHKNIDETEKPKELKIKSKPSRYNLIKRISDFFGNIIKQIREFKKNLQNLFQNTEKYIKMLFGYENKPAVELLKKVLFSFLKHVSPRKIRADIVIGTGDPCITGLAFGGIGLLISFWPGVYHIRPDFDNRRVEGRVYIKGKVRACVLLHYVIKVFRNDDVKRFRKQFNKARN